MKYDVVVMSKTGQIGSIININGLYSAAVKKDVRKVFKKQQFWSVDYQELARINSIFQ